MSRKVRMVVGTIACVVVAVVAVVALIVRRSE